MSIRGIIFDLDGTLLDTLPDIAASVNAGREAMGLSPRPVSDIRRWIGEGLPILCRRAIADAPEVSLDKMLPIVSEHYAAHRLDQAAPYAGVPELLDTLTELGIPLAILSNKPHTHTQPMAEAIFSTLAVRRRGRISRGGPTQTRSPNSARDRRADGAASRRRGAGGRLG